MKGGAFLARAEWAARYKFCIRIGLYCLMYSIFGLEFACPEWVMKLGVFRTRFVVLFFGKSSAVLLSYSVTVGRFLTDLKNNIGERAVLQSIIYRNFFM